MDGIKATMVRWGLAGEAPQRPVSRRELGAMTDEQADAFVRDRPSCVAKRDAYANGDWLRWAFTGAGCAWAGLEVAGHRAGANLRY